MKHSALIGNPTDHSVSHLMYEKLAKAAGLDEGYEHIRVNVEGGELRQAIEAFKTLRFAGLNVTLPHKLAVIEFMDDVDPVVEKLGAVNTIKLGGKTKGFNTDWIGIKKSVQRFGNKNTYETVTIFGAGGAARAAIYACKQLGAKRIHVLYREEASTMTNGLREQSGKLGILLQTYTALRETVKESQLIINATSAGMIGKEPLPFDTDNIKDENLNDKVFLDAVFNPLETPLLTYFKQQNAITIDGLWMMIYQGVGAISIWLDREINVSYNDLLRIHKLLEQELHNA